jgi:hypothetical protein
MEPINPNAIEDIRRLLSINPMPKEGTRVTIVGLGFNGDFFVKDGQWLVDTNFQLKVKG